jgi:inward rectifier potassium channel
MDRSVSDATKPDVGRAKTADLKVADLSRLRPRQRIALVRGQDSSRWTDIYHQALMQPWSVFMLGLLFVFIAINAVFALLYAADPHAIAGARPGSLWDAFLFSIQSVGGNNYSTMAPKTAYAHAIVVVETFTVNYAFLGLVMSLMFARFSRPFARIVFSKVALISPFDGVPTLMFRAANQRGNSVLDVEATVSVARRRITREGIIMRRFEELKLVRHRTSLFALSWTVMHTIDEASPLYGLTPETLANNEIEILVMLSGVDDTLADRIYSRYTYTPEDIVWGHRFVDVLSFTPHGRRVVDLNRFHDTEEVLQVDG